MRASNDRQASAEYLMPRTTSWLNNQHQKQDAGYQRTDENNGWGRVVLLYRFDSNRFERVETHQAQHTPDEQARNDQNDRAPKSNHAQNAWQGSQESPPGFRRGKERKPLSNDQRYNQQPNQGGGSFARS